MRRGNLEIHYFFTSKEMVSLDIDFSKLKYLRDMTCRFRGVAPEKFGERLKERLEKKARDADVVIVTIKRPYEGAYLDAMVYTCALWKRL
ncbi:MAG: hypothetical protein Q7S06_02695 [Nanoarchaeota archaeon]|nr:hypothetical protein [Nanoarchaeota archaeon]